MKFREFVGEEKIEKPKNTQENFVVSDVSSKYYLGFSISKNSLKRVFDYIKSWFLRYHIPFTPINPYLTLYLLKNIPYDKKDLIRSIKEHKNNVVFSPIDDGSITVITGNPNIIQLEYSPNYVFMNNIEDLFDDKNIEIIKEYCYINIFKMEKMISEKFLDDMMYSCPEFPDIKIGNVGILRRV